LVASFSATLNGSLDPHGLTTSVHFRYGTTTSYGLTTAPQSQSGNTFASVLEQIAMLLELKGRESVQDSRLHAQSKPTPQKICDAIARHASHAGLLQFGHVAI
jgi:hypothetical protein